MNPVLIVPGFGGSGPGHWQTLWENSNPSFRRVIQQDWDHPVCSEWKSQLEKDVAASGPDVILVAHSLACLLVAHWAADTRLKIKSALLVAVPDPASAAFPKEAVGFAPVPAQKFSFPSILVASTSDSFSDLKYSERCAKAWGSRFVNIGDAGHINADSNLGAWDEGFSLLKSLMHD